jgi:hypothetical protein
VPIPAFDCSPDVGSDVCCDTFSAKAERIRTVAWNAYLDCGHGGEGCGGVEANSYVTVGPIVDPKGDSVIVALQRVRPVTQTAGGHTPTITAMRAEYRVEVRTSGWPIISANPTGTRAMMPSPAQYGHAARHVVGHAEKAYRAIVNAVQTHTLFVPALHPDVIFKGVLVGDLTPVGPDSTIAGFAFAVSVDVSLRGPGW